MTTQTTQNPQPWWRYPHVWLVISGPLLVVIASLISGWIAMQSNDTDFNKDDEQLGLQPHVTPAQRQALVPAIQGRNQAATTAVQKQ
jgi:hypothetical protein